MDSRLRWFGGVASVLAVAAIPALLWMDWHPTPIPIPAMTPRPSFVARFATPEAGPRVQGAMPGAGERVRDATPHPIEPTRDRDPTPRSRKRDRSVPTPSARESTAAPSTIRSPTRFNAIIKPVPRVAVRCRSVPPDMVEELPQSREYRRCPTSVWKSTAPTGLLAPLLVRSTPSY